MKIIQSNYPHPDTVTHVVNNSLSRGIDSKVYTLNLTTLRGVFASQPTEAQIDHLDRITRLNDQDFKALATYQWRQK